VTVPLWIQIVGLLLAAVTAVLAALGLALGTAAVFGWRGIMKGARSAAAGAAKDAVAAYLNSPTMRDIVAKQADRMLDELLFSKQAAFPGAQSQGGEPPSPAPPVGNEYPEPENGSSTT
jgi:hypothetical protein